MKFVNTNPKKFLIHSLIKNSNTTPTIIQSQNPREKIHKSQNWPSGKLENFYET